jgi:hypothetical protein
MIRSFLVLGALLLASCTSMVAPDKVLIISVRNKTSQALEIEAHAGLLSTTITIPPGMVWRGWVLRELAPREVSLDMRTAPPAEAHAESEPNPQPLPKEE